jgi:hypothetical protein
MHHLHNGLGIFVIIVFAVVFIAAIAGWKDRP